VNLYKLSDEIIAYAEYLNYFDYKLDAKNTNNRGIHRGWPGPPGGFEEVENN